MATATRTITQKMHYPTHYTAWFAATQQLFHQVASFYFSVIQAHETVLDLSGQQALTVLETLTHATKQNLHPVMPLEAIAPQVPALFRRAAIHVAFGAAQAFFTNLRQWWARKEKAQAKHQPFRERPGVRSVTDDR